MPTGASRNNARSAATKRSRSPGPLVACLPMLGGHPWQAAAVSLLSAEGGNEARAEQMQRADGRRSRPAGRAPGTIEHAPEAPHRARARRPPHGERAMSASLAAASANGRYDPAPARNIPAPSIELVKCTVEDLDLCVDLCDTALRGDAYIPRGQMAGILKRHTSDFWLILLDRAPAGFAITYKSSVLHNMYLAPWARSAGVGGRVLEALAPKMVRSKSNMRAGDPQGFYERHGYTQVGQDESRPWIKFLARGEHVAPMKHEPHESAAPPAIRIPERDPNEENAMFLRLLRIVSGVSTKSTEEPVAPKSLATTAQARSGMTEIPEEDYKNLLAEVETFRARKAKHAAYQRSRKPKKSKPNVSSTERMDNGEDLSGN